MAYDYDGKGEDYEREDGSKFHVPKDTDVADAPLAFEQFAESIPFSEYVNVDEVTTDTRTVEEADNGKMLFVKVDSELTFGDLTEGFSVAIVGNTNVTVTYLGVDKENETTSEYEVATVVTVNGTNILSVARVGSSTPECPECPDEGADLIGGVAGWAAIESVTGAADLQDLKDAGIAPDTATADDDCLGTYNVTQDGVVWRVAVFTSGTTGSVQSSSGVADLFIVGASSTGTGGYISPGAFAARGLKEIASNNDVIAAEIPGQGSEGTQGKGSNFGSIGVGGGGSQRGAHGNVGGNDVPAGPGYGQFGSIPSSITGTLIHYCADGETQYENVDGGVDKWNWPGQGTNYNGPTPHAPRGGIVIVRAPKDATQPWEPAPELPGVGGWATITEVKGKGKKYEYTADGVEWSAFEWTDDGSVKTSGGLVDALLCGSGGAGSANWSGDAGYLITGLHTLNVDNDVKVGKGHAYNEAVTKSQLGSLFAGGGVSQSANGGGSSGSSQENILWTGTVSTIRDGNPVEYCQGVSEPLTSPGAQTPGSGSTGANSQDGVVIIRVPKSSDNSGLEGSEAGTPFDTTTLREALRETATEKVKSNRKRRK